LKSFQDIKKEASLGQITGYMDLIQECLDKIWNDDDILYPEARMENTLKIISKSIGSRIELEFKEHDLWQ
jgi:hypothetical protein